MTTATSQKKPIPLADRELPDWETPKRHHKTAFIGGLMFMLHLHASKSPAGKFDVLKWANQHPNDMLRRWTITTIYRLFAPEKLDEFNNVLDPVIWECEWILSRRYECIDGEWVPAPSREEIVELSNEYEAIALGFILAMLEEGDLK